MELRNQFVENDIQCISTLFYSIELLFVMKQHSVIDAKHSLHSTEIPKYYHTVGIVKVNYEQKLE